MARGRMLDQAFVRSKKLQSVHRDVRLLYASILPFLDREGRSIAEPLYLKGNVFRWSDFTVDEIAAGIKTMTDVGLIRVYADEDNAAILEYTGFLDLNSPNKKEAKSAFPGPDDPTAGPCRDPLLTTADESHMQSTGNAPEAHKNATGKSPITINGTERLTTNGRKEHSSTSNELTKPPSSHLAAAPPRETYDPGLFMEVWNANRGRLPAITTLNRKRKGAVRALVKEHGAEAALALFRDATRAVATDDFWLERQYGFDTLTAGGKVLTRAEQWRNNTQRLTTGDMRLARTAERVANAIGGLDDRPN